MENDNNQSDESDNRNDFQQTPAPEHNQMPEHHHIPEHHSVPVQNMSGHEQPQTFAHQETPDYNQTAQLPHHNSAGTIVLQWMTYALWGWTVFAMSFLTGAVFASYIEDTASDTFIAYAVAAVLVLLPMALVCDYLYSKREPLKKTGGASVVLIIHAVIFALFAIGSLITAVFSIISMVLNNGDNKTWKSALYTALVVGLLYSAVLIRVISPPRFSRFKRSFPLFMVAVVGILTILAFMGPVKKANETKNDRLIEGNISQLADKVSNYSDANHRLPASLSDIKATGDVQKLITDNLVVYKPNTKTQSKNLGVTDSSNPNYLLPQNIYYYQLCVTYKKASNDNYLGSNRTNDYQSYVSAYSHPAGEVCYKIATTPDYSSVQSPGLDDSNVQ